MDKDVLSQLIAESKVPPIFRRHHFDYYYAYIDVETHECIVLDSFDEIVCTINILEIANNVIETMSIRIGIQMHLIDKELIKFHDIVIIVNTIYESTTSLINNPTSL